MAGLYIHIPFCRQACHYCDFHFSTRQENRGELTAAIASELHLQKAYLKQEEIRTLYFGGGTPSLLTEEELNTILMAVRSNFTLHADAEITLEANPDDLTPEKLSALRLAGINRLSIGIQSFDNKVLKFLNRAHEAGTAVQCIADARAAGFDNISIDLMYAITGQTPETWKQNIALAISLTPEHISAYSLTLEEKTVFGKWQRTGKLRAVEDDTAAEEFTTLMSLLIPAGYEHYEISNFSRPGMHSRHNSNYWKQEAYLGVGPSAHSYDHQTRQANVSNNARYAKSILGGKVPYERELLTRENKINEYIFTTLRTSWGCDLALLLRQLQYDVLTEHSSYVSGLLQKNYATLENNILRLTTTGKLLADKIASDLFADAALDT